MRLCLPWPASGGSHPLRTLLPPATLEGMDNLASKGGGRAASRLSGPARVMSARRRRMTVAPWPDLMKPAALMAAARASKAAASSAAGAGARDGGGGNGPNAAMRTS
jgi:hypothetical protein